MPESPTPLSVAITGEDAPLSVAITGEDDLLLVLTALARYQQAMRDRIENPQAHRDGDDLSILRIRFAQADLLRRRVREALLPTNEPGETSLPHLGRGQGECRACGKPRAQWAAGESCPVRSAPPPSSPAPKPKLGTVVLQHQLRYFRDTMCSRCGKPVLAWTAMETCPGIPPST